MGRGGWGVGMGSLNTVYKNSILDNIKGILWFDFLYHFMHISTMPTNEKPLEWIGSSHKDLMALPADVRRLFGFALSLAQVGDKHEAAKVLKGFGGAGVLEVVEDDVDGTYRAVYTVKFFEAVFVLHCFQKKSKRGIATPKEDMDIIHARLKIAEAYVKELRK
jgi:phage-related protein